MNVARMNTKIVFEKNEKIVDKVHNHKNEWTFYFSCFATIGSERGKEENADVLILDNSEISFTVRYCKKVKDITSTNFRVLWNDEVYNIIKVDHLNLRKRAFKFKCKKEGRK